MSLFGLGGDSGAQYIDKAVQALKEVNVPNAESLSLPELQKYVQAGILTPEQFQAISADPDTYRKTVQATLDTSGTEAQKAALQQLGGVVQAGGSTPINQANLINNINQTNQAMQAARQGIMQNAQERGVAGGGLEFMQQLTNEQGNAQNANLGAVNAAANNAQLALNAMTQQGQLGGQLQGQSNQMSQAQAEAAQQIAEYNSQLQSQANQYNTQAANQARAANLGNLQDVYNQNTGLANQRTMYNAQVPETMFQNAMQKAGGVANAYTNAAQTAAQTQASQNALTGNLIGTGATLLGTAYGGPVGGAVAGTTAKKVNAAHGGEVQHMWHGGSSKCYAQGGEVHDHSLCMKAGGGVPGEEETFGDSETNDTVPAMLSPHEIVLPKSVAQAPDAPQQAAQFVQQTKGLTPTVGSFQEVLKILEANGIELRLASAGDSNAY